MTEFDFVAIGDTVTDAFIRLQDPYAHVDIDHDAREICMRFGDKIPYESVTEVVGVGNAANAAVAAARLGLKTAFVANVGEDRQGEAIIKMFKGEGVATDYIASHAGMKTNYHYVLWYKDDRTILVKHELFPYALPVIEAPKWMYLSSLGENSLDLHMEIEEYLKSNPEVKLAFQPGTYQMKFGKEALKGIYQRTEIFFSNKEEAERILDVGETDIKTLLAKIHALGPKRVCITDGPNGAYAFDGNEYLKMRTYPDPKAPLQRTGAGDAFSSTVTAALAMGMDLKEALRWGPVNSMSVVQKVGAQAGLLPREKLEELLQLAPQDYHPVSI